MHIYNLACRVWHLHTRDFNSLFKKDNREQKKFLVAHWKSCRKVPYSADWFITMLFVPKISFVWTKSLGHVTRIMDVHKNCTGGPILKTDDLNQFELVDFGKGTHSKVSSGTSKSWSFFMLYLQTDMRSPLADLCYGCG